MLSIATIRENVEAVRYACQQKKKDIDIDRLIALDDERKNLQNELDGIKFQQKTAGAEGKYDVAKELKTSLVDLQAKYDAVYKEYNDMLRKVPNLIHPDTPVGPNEDHNVVIRKVGTPREFSFTPKDHEELGVALGMLDKEQASLTTGARFFYLMGELALLQNALIQHTMSVLTNPDIIKSIIDSKKLNILAKGFTPVVPPLFVNYETADKMGRLYPMDDRYCLEEDKFMLIGSSEHILGPLHMNQNLPEKDLPKRYFACTPCFRREAGTYGKDARGILRTHQFDKIEMEIFSTPETSEAEQDLIIGLQEYLISSLGLPYQVVSICTGDMGNMDYRQVDMETYMPGQSKYRETHTSDLMTDYQARRLNITLTRNDGTREFVHMNDATAFAIGRILIAVRHSSGPLI